MSPSALSVTRHGRPYDAVTQLREIPTCKSPFSKCIWHGGGGWLPGCQLLSPSSLVTRPGSVSALLTYHACRLPPGTWPTHGSYLSQWFSIGGAYCRVPTPHAQILRELSLSLLVLGVWLGNHLSLLLLLFWGIEARGLHALTAPPPIMPLPYCAAPSTVTPTHGYRGVAPPNCKRFLVWTQSTPEAWSTPLLTSLRPWWVLPSVDFGQCPRTGQYNMQYKLREKKYIRRARLTRHTTTKKSIRQNKSTCS